MELLTKALLKQLPPIDSTEGEPDPMVLCKFFYPTTLWRWYATEFDGADQLYGVVATDYVKMGYFSLKALKATRGPHRLPIERDRDFIPCPLSVLIGRLRAAYGAYCLI